MALQALLPEWAAGRNRHSDYCQFQTAELVELFIHRTTAGTARVGANVPEFVVKAVQVLTEQPYYLHTELTMIAKELHQAVLWNEGYRCMVTGFGRDPVLFA